MDSNLKVLLDFSPPSELHLNALCVYLAHNTFK